MILLVVTDGSAVYLIVMTVVIAGENDFIAQRELRARIAAFAKAHGELAVERLHAEEADMARIQQALSETSLFAPERLVVLESPSAHKAFQEKAAELLASVPETTQVIVVEPKPDKRTTYYKFLKKQAEFVVADPLDARQLPTWAMAYAKEQGATLSRSDAQYLVDRQGGASQQRLASEIEKLARANGTITRESIDALTDKSPQSKIFDLLEAAFAGNGARAMDVYDEQRAQKVEPQEIMAMIGWQLRQVALAKFAQGHSLSEAKINGYAAQKAENAARRMTQQQVKDAVARLVAIDALSKQAPLDVDEAVRAYILTLHH